MEIRISGKNTEISDDLRLFTERKVGKLEKYFSRDMAAMVTLSQLAGKKGSRSHSAEVVMHIKGKVISASEATENFFIAVDAVVEKLRRQLKREKNKWLEKTKDVRDAPQPAESETAEELEPGDGGGMEIRPFTVKPMSAEEAVAALKGTNQNFFMFVNNDQTINCVFRREDGGYGLMVPESAITG